MAAKRNIYVCLTEVDSVNRQKMTSGGGERHLAIDLLILDYVLLKIPGR